jgi:indolepyruvate ferredoxin oxidoreductase alpha subunit
MGGSISTGHGAAMALGITGRKERVVAVIGDSTFFHSGITSLMDVAYNGGRSVSVILDNRITGMTGHQENPGTGYTLMGGKAAVADIPALCKAMGIKGENIYLVNPLELDAVGAALDDALSKDEPTVIITRWPCILKKFSPEDRSEFGSAQGRCEIDQDACRKCGQCVKTGCPAICSGDSVVIDGGACVGCTVCLQVCPFGAIKEVRP